MDRRSALAALLGALAALATTRAAWAAEPTAAGPPEPVPVSVQTVPLSSHGSQAVRTVTSATPFAMVGLSWSGATPEVLALRARQGQGWSEWTSVAVAQGATWGFAASEPVWTGVSQQLEICALRGGAPAQGVSAVLLDPGRSPLDLAPPVDPARGYPVVSRAGWGADESIRCSDAAYDDEIRAVALHHTATGNDYRPEDSAGIVRSIYTYHAQTLGWCDIGYHALADKYGRVFEGRAGGLDRPVIGAHAGGFNRRTSSISMIGRYTGVQPTQPQREALAGFLDWKLGLHGLDPHGEATLLSQGGDTSKYPAGTTVRVPVLFGHRDVGNTECPGDDGYALLPPLRSAVARRRG